MPVVKPHKKRLQLLRKRKGDVDTVSNDDSEKCINIEREILTQNVWTADVLDIMDSDNRKFQNSKYTNSKKDSQNCLISVRRIEDLCKTPKKNISNNLVNIEDIKKEDLNNAHTCSPFDSDINTVEQNSQNSECLIATSCRREKYNLNNNAPNFQMEKKLSFDISDCDELPNITSEEENKSDLYNAIAMDVENIDLLHDLNSVMNFEKINLPTNCFTSTPNNVMENRYNVQISKDPLIDPLFIPDSQEYNTTVEGTDRDDNRKQIQNRHEQSNIQSDYAHNTECTQKTESNNNHNFNILSDILGELDIESDAENEEIPQEALERLYNLEVELMHEIPKQHQIEHTSGSKGLTKKQRKLFLQHGPMKRGVFSPREDEIIINNWKLFCEVHNWNPKHVRPFLCMIHDNKFYIKNKEERQNFVRFLANGLPWRSLYSVYHRFKYLHGNHENSFKRYTLAEDKQILSYMDYKTKKKKKHKVFSELAEMLGRTSHSVWLRYQSLKSMKENAKGKSLVQVKWTLPLIGKFIKTLMDITLCENVNELKDAILPKVIWLKLESKLNIVHDVLKSFWINQLHMQLFCPEPIYLNDIKIKLIEYIYGKGIASTREIIWPNVAKYFDGITTIFLCKTFYFLLTENAIKLNTNNFPDIIEYLYSKRISMIQNEPTDKFLPRLSYNNGKVKIIDEDLSET